MLASYQVQQSYKIENFHTINHCRKKSAVRCVDRAPIGHTYIVIRIFSRNFLTLKNTVKIILKW